MTNYVGDISDQDLTRKLHEVDGKLVVETHQDISGFIKRNKYERENFGMNYTSKSKDMAKYAEIPNVVVEELFYRGLNVYDKNDTKKIAYVIETEYPWCLTSTASMRLK